MAENERKGTEEDAAREERERGGFAFFAGYFMRPLCITLRINAETRPGLQVHSRLVASAVGSALIQAVFSASSPAMKRRSAF